MTEGYPLGFLRLRGAPKSVVDWTMVVLAVTVLITAVGVIGEGFQAAAGGRAEQLFRFAENPFVGLMIGVLATVLTQSSTTTTSITVGLVAGGLPISIAIPILFGANIGTTLTALIAAFSFSGIEGQTALQTALVHLLYNLMAATVVLLTPGLRRLPPRGATILSRLGTRNTWYIVAWILLIFLIIPGTLLLFTVVI